MNPWNLVVLFGAFVFAQAGFSQAPNITKQPDSVNSGRGGTVTLSVSYTALNPKFQWFQNGDKIPNATNVSLVISNVQPAHAGRYSLLITNTWGERASSNATLVIGPVTIWGNSMAANIPLSLTNAVAIAAGEDHMVALKPDRQATTWSKMSNSATNIPSSASNVVGIAAPRKGSFFLRSDGTVVDSSGLSTPSYATNIAEIAAGNGHCVGLRRDGTVVAWSSGLTSATNFPTWLNDAVSVSASTTYSLAVRANGKVQYWGSAPGMSNFLDSASDIISAAAGTDHCLVLKSDGTVLAAGANEYGQTNVPAGLSGVVGVVAGAQVSYALKSDGTLVAWGRNTSGQTNVPPGLGAVATVTTRFNQTAALTSDGNPSLQVQPLGIRTVSGESYVLRARASGSGSLSYQWYFNGVAIEGANSADLVVNNAKSEASGSYYVVVTNSLGAITSRVALVQVRPWSSLEMWGHAGGLNSNLPSELSELRQVSAGPTHCIALTMDGKAICWGDPSQGQCDVPANATNLIYVMAGSGFSGAIRNDGRLLIWGSTNAPLVNPDTDQLKMVAPLSEPVSVYEWAALKTDGTVYVGGYSYGRQALPGFTNIQTIASRESHLIGLRSNGTVAVWSPYARPFLTPPQDLTNVIGVAAGDYFAVALKADGSAVAWGHPETVAPVPTDLTNAVWIAAAGRWCMAGTSDGRLISWSGTPVDPETFQPLNVPDRWDGISSVSVQRQYALALSTNRSAHITQTPRNRSIPLGFPVEFKAWASGQPPINYQWQFNGTDIPGATARTLAITNAGSQDGEYRVIVTNLFGSATSTVAKLATGSLFSWGDNSAEQCWTPQSATNCTKISAGSDQSAALQRDGHIQTWGGLEQRHGPQLQQVTSAIDVNCGGDGGIALLQNGTARVWGSTPSAPDLPPGLKIVSADMDFTGQPMTVLSDGSLFTWDDPTHWWTNKLMVSTPVDISAGGGFAIVLNQDGTAGTWGFDIIRPAIAAVEGVVQTAANNVKGYVLRFDGTVLGPSSATPLATNVVSISAGGQRVLALRKDGTLAVLENAAVTDYAMAGVLSNVVEVAAGYAHNIVRFGNGSPHITVNPFSRPVLAGTNALLTTLAVGAQPMSYQWQKNGIDLFGQTNSSLLLTQAQLATAGDYRCVVSNALGSETGKVASVSVVFPPPSLVPSVNPVTTDGFKFSVGNLSAQGPLVIYSSTNLVDWQPIWTNAPGPNAIEFIDSAVTNSGTKYYRASELR